MEGRLGADEGEKGDREEDVVDEEKGSAGRRGPPQCAMSGM